MKNNNKTVFGNSYCKLDCSRPGRLGNPARYGRTEDKVQPSPKYIGVTSCLICAAVA